MTDDWDPTIRDRDGNPVDVSENGDRPPHQRENVLRDLKDQGLRTQEIADELGVSHETIRRQFHRHGLEFPDKYPDDPATHALDMHDEYDVDMIVNRPGDGDVDETQTIYSCPDCGTPYLTEASQHTCMRSHAKATAEELAARAAGGEEVLPL